jgi:site-specific recombinase XerD
VSEASVGDFEVVVRWMDWLQARELSEATIRLYSYGVFRLLTEQRIARIDAVTEEHVVAFLKSIGNRSVAKRAYLRGIRSLCSYALARGEIRADPTAGLALRKVRRPPKVALTEEELFRYLMAAYAQSPRRAWTLMLVFGTGTRRMEAASIMPDDVQGGEVHLRVCKYSKQRRVPLGPYALFALEQLRPWYNGTVLGGIGPQTITEWAHQAAVDSGLLPKVRGRVAHVLRASFATHLLRQGVPVHVVRDLLGHENIATTNEYAAASEDGEKRAAVGHLDFGARRGADSGR